MGQPFKTISTTVNTQNSACGVALLLIRRSAWFEMTPMPDDKWHFIVKPENASAFPLGSQIEGAPPCVGCS